MAVNRLKERNAAIEAEFERLYKEGYRSEVIYDKLAEQFYLAPSTVYHIVSGYYDRRAAKRAEQNKPDPNQGTIDFE